MAAPTGLTIKNNLNDMQVGGCIPCRYTATIGAAGYFSELGTCIAAEIPITGTATPDGLFYLIKVDKGIFIADRVLQTGISWDVLNAARLIEGCTINLTKGANISSSSGWTNLNAIKDDYITGPWNYCTATLNSVDILIDLKNINNIKDIRGVLTTDVLYQYNSKATILFSSDGINFTEYGYIEHLSAPTGLVSAVKTYNGEVNCRYIKLQNFIAGTYPYATLNELQILSTFSIRCMTGGVAYLDTDGNPSLTDKLLGAWPPNNEWDKYIVNSDLKGKITKGDDNVWHWEGAASWMKDPPLTSLWGNTARTIRGDYLNYNRNNYFSYGASGGSYGSVGFRPVLNYIESDIASEVIY